jgi:hypothetical protein
MVIVVVFIPIAIGVPTIAFYVPPAVFVRPAIFARVVQFVPGFVSLFAFHSMMVDCLVEFMVGVHQTFLTIFGFRARRRREHQEARCKSSRSQARFPICDSFARVAAMSHFPLLNR